MKAKVLNFKMPFWLLLILLLNISNRANSIAVDHDESHDDHDQQHHSHEDQDEPYAHLHEESNHDEQEDNVHEEDHHNLETHSQETDHSQEEVHSSPDNHHHHDHDHEHHGQEESVVDKDSISHDSHTEFTIKSYQEDCTGANVKCNVAEGLICAEDLGKCECNRGMVYHSEKCQVAPEPIEENSLENDEELNIELAISEEDESPAAPTTSAPSDNNKLQGDTHDHDEGEEEQENKQARRIEIPVNKCENVDCSEKLGKFSACDENTGECTCKDIEEGNRNLRIVNGQCLIDRGINDPCNAHHECNETITGNAWCHLDSATMKRFCQCEMNNYYDDSLGECLELAHDGLSSPCKKDLQCTGSKEVGIGFGPNARCSEESSKCECKLGPSNQKGFFYENTCIYEMKMGDACKVDRECELAIPEKDAVCSIETKTCVCKEGNEDQDCKRNVDSVGINSEGRLLQNDQVDGDDDDGMLHSLKSAMGLDVPNFVFITIIVAVVVLIIVVLAVFVLKKRHKYSVVRTRDNVEDPRS